MSGSGWWSIRGRVLVCENINGRRKLVARTAKDGLVRRIIDYRTDAVFRTPRSGFDGIVCGREIGNGVIERCGAL